MGKRADVIVIGPKGVLQEHGVLDYPDKFYDDVDDDAVVLGTVAGANSNEGSDLLATICGVRTWDLGHHRVLHPVCPVVDEYIGDELVFLVYDRIKKLVRCWGVQMWYRPNG